jgi:hypothetical protein
VIESKQQSSFVSVDALSSLKSCEESPTESSPTASSASSAFNESTAVAVGQKPQIQEHDIGLRVNWSKHPT